ncbi:MAG TPA: S-adenosylmethionine:tRNA ribosyltransferase-isomerase [Thermoplasmata archaeon]|nr:S-adenosylmethionine:tRNA ribosyltransferase-isomerase [Thermoplasmata archaeon]
MTGSAGPEQWSLLPEAHEPPEQRGLARDEVRLLLSAPGRTAHRRFTALPELLGPGDLLVVNRSSTVPASLAADSPWGPITVNVSTHYGRGLWLVEPRRSPAVPGPLPFIPGDALRLAGLAARVVAAYPGIPRLHFVRCEGDLERRMEEVGRPVEYGHLSGHFPLAAYQTIFASVHGSAEMPSAGRPFSWRVVRALEGRGVRLQAITLHTGVSSVETGDIESGYLPVFPEPFEVTTEVAESINETRAHGGRVIAVGTSVVRALESAWDGVRVRGAAGFTRAYVDPAHPPRAVDGVLSGFHNGRSTHIALLQGFLGRVRLAEAYEAARAGGYLRHEFGDCHLMLN